MSRQNEVQIEPLLERLVMTGEGAPPLEDKLTLAHFIRGHSRESSRRLDEFLLEQVSRLRTGLEEARYNLDHLNDVFRRISAPPLFPAVFLGLEDAGGEWGAAVLYSGSHRVVRIADDIEPLALEAGDKLLLNSELNLVVGRSTAGFLDIGETGIFDRLTTDGRAILKWRDEEVVVHLSGALKREPMAAGDQVRWDRGGWMALERIERSSNRDLFLEDTPTETFEQIGGLGRQISALQRVISLHFYHPEVVRRYKLRRKGSVLLVGPPGTGKTMMARALANWLGGMSSSGRSRFINIKPAGLHSEWYGRTEANYREAFRSAREAGEQEPDVPVVMFFDEIDSVGGTRGRSWAAVDDRVLTAFMTELDGLEGRGNILVVAATNRRDAIDPALLRPGRLGDLVLEVPRPDARAARQILGKYIDEGLAYAEGLGDGTNVRDHLIEAAVSRLYAPNAENELATLTFRDGKRRSVRAADLVSGASLAKIAADATERAGVRDLETGERGLRLEDIYAAIADEFESASGVLSPANCHGYISDLPQDVDVVRVEPIRARTLRRHLYMSAA